LDKKKEFLLLGKPIPVVSGIVDSLSLEPHSDQSGVVFQFFEVFQFFKSQKLLLAHTVCLGQNKKWNFFLLSVDSQNLAECG
jgi:hypothetical protein